MGINEVQALSWWLFFRPCLHMLSEKKLQYKYKEKIVK